MENTKLITGYLIDPKTNTAKPAMIQANLSSYYETLSCDIIDIGSRTIGGKRYAVICDDEALCKADPLISAISDWGQPMLFNALFVVNEDYSAGELLSLTQEDIDHISKHIHHHGTRLHPEGWKMLCQVDY